MTRAEFLQQAAAAARVASATSGFPAGITVAQAALESAWGGSRLSQDANNYFGIKSHGGRPFIELPTTESVAGKPVPVTARFTRYGSMAECFADRDAIVARVPLYAEARAAASDPEAFLRALAKHWATDPDYAEKVLHIYRAHSLFTLDTLFTPDTPGEEKP
jgi:flagellum-specific peptidoglycan hydrolase FlgJ